MKIARFNSAAYTFPPSWVPTFPCLIQIQAGKQSDSFALIRTNAGAYRSFRRGRYALAEAYRLAGVTRDTALLAPAYHCLTMLDGAVSLGAEILLYPLRHDLSVDLDELNKVIHDSSRPVKALLATHFFGIIQNFDNLRQWCAERDIVLVEDCSHVLFTEEFQAKGAGVYGKYVVSSPYKFIACEDGGLLYASNGNLLEDVNVRTSPPSLVEELRGLKHVIENHWASRTPPPKIEEIGSQAASLFGVRNPSQDFEITEYDHPSYSYAVANRHKSALHLSKWLIRHSRLAENARQRRKNFLRWVEAVEGLPHCRALYRTLHEECVPYMFPLYLDHPDPHFNWLKQLGVPLCRWNSLVVSSCPASTQYRLSLLHLPCHQSLTEEQMAWMIAAVREVMNYPIPEAD